jgi:hypothetical protein
LDAPEIGGDASFDPAKNCLRGLGVGPPQTFGELAATRTTSQVLLDPGRDGSFDESFADFAAIHIAPSVAFAHINVRNLS